MFANSLLASANSSRFAALHSAKLRQADSGARAVIQHATFNADPSATVTANVKYRVGPDGQLYAAGGTVTTSSHSSSVENKRTPLLNPIKSKAALPQAARNDNQPRAGLVATRPATLADVLSNKLQLSPLDFALSFSDEFVDDINRAQQAITDGAVRSQETLHFRAAGGLATGLPHYGTETGIDGEHYATSGHVNIQASGSKDAAKASRDATTISIAATAPGDASAQDFFVAKSALSQAASFYQQAGIQERELDIFG